VGQVERAAGVRGAPSGCAATEDGGEAVLQLGNSGSHGFRVIH